MKKSLTVLALMIFAFTAKSQLYRAETCEVSFFSKTSMEDIDAMNRIEKPLLDSKSGTIAFKIHNTSFKFKSALMEEHFNENYMESDKYPESTFQGKINEKVDYCKNGEYDVTVTGKMNMHGVTKDETYKGKLSVKDGKVIIHCKFIVKLKDYKIKVPTVVAYNVAEEIEVTINTTMAPFSPGAK